MPKSVLQTTFETLKRDLPGLKAISAVEVETGLSEGSLLVDKSFDLEAASAYNSEVLKAKIKAKNAMGMTKENVELIIIELSSQIHLIQPSPTEKYLLYVASDKGAANLGLVRKVVKDAAKKLEEVLN